MATLNHKSQSCFSQQGKKSFKCDYKKCNYVSHQKAGMQKKKKRHNKNRTAVAQYKIQ